MSSDKGKIIGDRRRELGLSQRQLGELCDYTEQSIRNAETGKNGPSDRIFRTVIKKMDDFAKTQKRDKQPQDQPGDSGRLANRIESMRPDQRQRMISIMLSKIPTDQIPAIYEAFISMNEAPNDSGSQKIRTTTAS